MWIKVPCKLAPDPSPSRVAGEMARIVFLGDVMLGRLVSSPLPAGAPAVVYLEPYPGEAFRAHVAELAPVVDPQTMRVRGLDGLRVVDASVFLLENGGVNGVNLDVDGGWLLR